MTNPNKQKALLISPGFDAMLSELNKASCCLATMCALVYFCMVGFAKVFLLLILSCEWELSCAVLCWISNALHLSFWISGLFNMRPGNERPAPNVHFTSPVRCCVAAKALKLWSQTLNNTPHLWKGFYVFQEKDWTQMQGNRTKLMPHRKGNWEVALDPLWACWAVP